jgi:PAS domain S-box-containing protein
MSTNRLLLAGTTAVLGVVGLSLLLIDVDLRNPAAATVVAIGALPFATLGLPRLADRFRPIYGVYAAAWIGMLIYTTGGTESPYHLLFPILLMGAALGSPRRRFTATGLAAVVAASAPLVYSEPTLEFTAVLLVNAALWIVIATIVHLLVGRLRRTEESLRVLAENADDLLYRLDLSPRLSYDYLSPAVDRITGYSADELRSDPDLPLRHVHPDDRAALLATRKRPEEVRAEPIEFRFKRKGGDWVWLEERIHPIRNTSGDVIAITGIVRDVTRRKAVEEKLRETLGRERLAAEKVRSLSDQKTAFLQAVSHEIRTPLAAILGFSVTIRDHGTELGPEQVEHLVERVVVSAQKLSRIVENLLDVDRLTTGVVRANLQTVDLASTIRSVIAETETGDRPLTLHLDPVIARVDPQMIERIVENLVANAIRHTPSNTPMTVRLEEEGDDVHLAVEDAGPGVPDDLKVAIFEPFRQGSDSMRSASPGTGIGLTLVHRLAAIHGGRAWVDDRPGGGSRFHVTLPASVSVGSSSTSDHGARSR